MFRIGQRCIMDENSVCIPNRKKVEELSEITNHKQTESEILKRIKLPISPSS